MFEEIEKVILQLLDDGLEESADKICSLLISNYNYFQGNELKLLSLQGDCAFIKGEYSRALQLYRQALNGGQLKRLYIIDNIDLATIHYKVSQCLLKLGDKTTAIRELEVIPKELRTTKINILLGKLYYGAELKLSANGVLKQVIKSSPLAIECMEMLINLGVEPIEFLTKYKIDSHIESKDDDNNNNNNNNNRDEVDMNINQNNNITSICYEWITPIIESYSLQNHSKFPGILFITILLILLNYKL